MCRINCHKPGEANPVAHCAHSEVSHKVHSTRVDLIDSIPPVIESAPVRVKDGEIEGGIPFKMLHDERKQVK